MRPKRIPFAISVAIYTVVLLYIAEKAYGQQADQLSPEQWCAQALMLAANPKIAEQGREAFLEMARNRGCLRAPPPKIAAVKPKFKKELSTVCKVDFLLIYVGPPEDKNFYAEDAAKNNCGPLPK